MLVPPTSKTADEIAPDERAQYITEWIQVYGPPEMRQSDNGCEFKGAVETLLEAYGIKIKHASSNTHVQGLVEQVIQNQFVPIS